MRFRYSLILLLILIVNFAYAKKHESSIIDPILSTIPSESIDLNQDNLGFVPYKLGKLPLTEGGYYFLKGTINVEERVKTPALLITPAAYPFTVYINGCEVYNWGNGKNSKYRSSYDAIVVTIKNVALKGSNKITVRFYSDGEKTPLSRFRVGDFNDLRHDAFIQSFFNHYLITGLVLTALFAAFLFTGYFMVSGQKEQEILFFVLASLFFVLSYLNMVFSSQLFSEIVFLKISRFSLLMVPFFLLRFAQSYTGVFERYKKLFWIPFYIAISAGLYMALLPEENSINRFFSVLQIIVALPELMILMMILVYDNFKNSRKDKSIILLGFVVLTVTALRDIYFSSNSLVPDIWIIPYGFFIQIFSIAFAIIIRQKELYISALDYKEKLLKANAQIQVEANKRERFLDTIASELRSPMNGLEERIHDIDKEKSLSFNSISGAFRRIRITLNNIFDYVAIRDEQLRILDHDFDLFKAIDILNGFYFEMATKKNLKFSMAYDKDLLPEYFHGDREHLIQVMDNLLHNAIKYTSEGGVSCSIVYRNGELIFSVSDTGRGIDSEGKDTLRRAISSNDYKSFSDKYEGVGLGLTITDMIVRKMNGRINLESREDQGTTILVSIPLGIKEDDSPKDISGKILVVEDNKVNAMIITKLLKKVGYNYDVVENGLLAVKEIQKKYYDVILMDVEMPIMDGIQATRKIRQFNQDTPIIAVTANGQFDECIEAGMNDHLMKPVNFEYLKEILRKHISEKVAV